MKFLITGDRGFVGTETKKVLEENGHTWVGFDLMDGYDIRDVAQFHSAVLLHSPNAILHLAAVARFADADKDPQLAFETNVLGTMNVVDAATQYHKPLVYASTGSVYMPIDETPPITESFKAKGNSVYGCSKYAGETYVREHTPHIILRYAHLYGREKRMHGLIGGYVERIQRGLAPTLYGGKQSNDFTYIKDVARANMLALTAPWDKWNQVYNIGTGEELTAEQAGDLVIKAWNTHNPDKKFNGKIEKKEQRTVDPGRFVYDMTKAKVMLNFTPEFTFEKGLMDMFAPEMVKSPFPLK